MSTEASKEKVRIAVIDDERMLLNVFSSLLRQFHYHADLFSHPSAAFEAIVTNPGYYSLVISDIRMAEMDGFTFAKKVRIVFPELPFIFMTGNLTEDIKKEAEAMGQVLVLQKPFPLISILDEQIKKLIGFKE